MGALFRPILEQHLRDSFKVVTDRPLEDLTDKQLSLYVAANDSLRETLENFCEEFLDSDDTKRELKRITSSILESFDSFISTICGSNEGDLSLLAKSVARSELPLRRTNIIPEEYAPIYDSLMATGNENARSQIYQAFEAYYDFCKPIRDMLVEMVFLVEHGTRIDLEKDPVKQIEGLRNVRSQAIREVFKTAESYLTFHNERLLREEKAMAITTEILKTMPESPELVPESSVALELEEHAHAAILRASMERFASEAAEIFQGS